MPWSTEKRWKKGKSGEKEERKKGTYLMFCKNTRNVIVNKRNFKSKDKLLFVSRLQFWHCCCIYKS